MAAQTTMRDKLCNSVTKRIGYTVYWDLACMVVS